MTPALAFAALYNAARPQGLGFLHYDPTPLTETDAEKILAEYGRNFDYYKGRVLKVQITDDGVAYTELYNRDNGNLAAEYVLASAEITNDPNNAFIQEMHHNGTRDAAELARSLAARPTQSDDTGGIHMITLGCADVAQPLIAAVDKAQGERL